MLLGGCSRQTLRIDIISGDFMSRLEAHVGNEQNPDSGLKFTLLPRSCKHSGNWNSYYIKVTTTQIFQLMSSTEVHSAETAKFSHEPTTQLKASIRSLQTSFLLQSGITNIKQTKWQIPRSGVLFFSAVGLFFFDRESNFYVTFCISNCTMGSWCVDSEALGTKVNHAGYKHLHTLY